MFKWLKQKFSSSMINVLFGGGAFSFQDAPVVTEKDYLDSFAVSNLVKSAVTRIADQCATIELELYRAQFGKVKEIEQHEILDILANPNPIMSGSDMFALMAIYEKLLGDAYLYKARGASGKVIELWPMRSDLVTVKLNFDGSLKGYEYNAGQNGIVFYAAEEVIHFKTPNPLNLYKGVGDVQGLIEIIRSDYFSKKWNTKFFFNDATPNGILTTDGTMTDSDRNEIKEVWNSKYAGIGNAHKVAVLANGLKFQSASTTHNDMQFKDMRTISRDDVLMTLGVPKSVMSVSDDVNRANAETGVYVFLSMTIEPMFRRWREKINHSLVRQDFDPGLYLTYVDPTPENQEKLDNHYTKAVNKWMTVNEAREEMGYDPVEGGDIIYQPMGLLPLGEDREVIDDNNDAQKMIALKAKPTRSLKERKIDRIYKEALRGNKRLRAQEEIFRTVVDSVQKSLKKKGKSSFTKAQKKQIWKMYDVRLRKWEDYWEMLQGKWFEGQRKRINSALKDEMGKSKGVADGDFVDWDAENDAFAKKAKPVIREIVKESGEYGMNLVGTFYFNPEDELTAKWIDEKAMKFASDVNETTKEKLKKTLADGLLEGEGVGQLAKRVNEVMEGRIASSAKTIARTEVLSASNAGSMFGYKQSGLVSKKEWLSTLDGKTRHDHVSADGQIRTIDQSFTVGGSSLDYPGDPNGSADQIVNCRCTVLPVITVDN